MNWDIAAGNWAQMKGKLRQKWGKLTDDDIEMIKGKRDELVGRLQKVYGLQKDEAERQADDFAKTVH